jgi:hypothetical protein
LVYGNHDASTAPLSAGPIQSHGTIIRGVQSPARDGPVSTATPRAGPVQPRALKNQICFKWAIRQNPEQFEGNGSVGDGAGAGGDRNTQYVRILKAACLHNSTPTVYFIKYYLPAQTAEGRGVLKRSSQVAIWLLFFCFFSLDKQTCAIIICPQKSGAFQKY